MYNIFCRENTLPKFNSLTIFRTKYNLISFSSLRFLPKHNTIKSKANFIVIIPDPSLLFKFEETYPFDSFLNKKYNS